MSHAFAETLAGCIEVSPEGCMNKTFPSGRSYVSTKRVCTSKRPRKVQTLVPMETVLNGTAFPALSRNTGGQTCCLQRRCNGSFSMEVAESMRKSVPRAGEDGCCLRRTLYVRERTVIASDGRFELLLGDVFKQEVCTPFFCKVTGISTTTIQRSQTWCVRKVR